jgi:hypothetical protein
VTVSVENGITREDGKEYGGFLMHEDGVHKVGCTRKVDRCLEAVETGVYVLDQLDGETEDGELRDGGDAGKGRHDGGRGGREVVRWWDGDDGEFDGEVGGRKFRLILERSKLKARAQIWRNRMSHRLGMPQLEQDMEENYFLSLRFNHVASSFIHSFFVFFTLHAAALKFVPMAHINIPKSPPGAELILPSKKNTTTTTPPTRFISKTYNSAGNRIMYTPQSPRSSTT